MPHVFHECIDVSSTLDACALFLHDGAWEAGGDIPLATSVWRYRYDALCGTPHRPRRAPAGHAARDRLPPGRHRAPDTGCRAAAPRGAVPVARPLHAPPDGWPAVRRDAAPARRVHAW